MQRNFQFLGFVDCFPAPQSNPWELLNLTLLKSFSRPFISWEYLSLSHVIIVAPRRSQGRFRRYWSPTMSAFPRFRPFLPRLPFPLEALAAERLVRSFLRRREYPVADQALVSLYRRHRSRHRKPLLASVHSSPPAPRASPATQPHRDRAVTY